MPDEKTNETTAETPRCLITHTDRYSPPAAAYELGVRFGYGYGHDIMHTVATFANSGVTLTRTNTGWSEVDESGRAAPIQTQRIQLDAVELRALLAAVAAYETAVADHQAKQASDPVEVPF